MHDSLLDVVRTIPGLHFKYVDQFLVALLPMLLTVALHGKGMSLVTRCVRYFIPKPHPGMPLRKQQPYLLLIISAAIMLAAHFLEVVLWAVFFVGTGILDSSDQAMFFSMNNYSTLGTGAIELQEKWRGIAGFEAMVSMLMFGWSTAVLALVVQKLPDFHN